MNIVNMLNGKWVIINNEQAQQNPGALGNAWFVDSLTYVKTADEEMKFLDKFNPATSAVADAKLRAGFEWARHEQYRRLCGADAKNGGRLDGGADGDS